MADRKTIVFLLQLNPNFELVTTRYVNELMINQKSCNITEKATTALTFMTLLRHYAKRALTPR